MEKRKKSKVIFTESRRDGFFGNSQKLKRKTIINAISGDPIALMEIVAVYRPYIEALSLREVIDNDGRYREEVDETVQRILETSLMAAVMKFNPYRK